MRINCSMAAFFYDFRRRLTRVACYEQCGVTLLTLLHSDRLTPVSPPPVEHGTTQD